MQKSTTNLIIVIVVAITILGVAGEYFLYNYYSSLNHQPLQTGDSNQPTATQPNPNSSAEDSIITFNLTNPMAVGTIDSSKHTVVLTVPPDTDITKLSPTIEISNNATISPLSNTPQSFLKPVIYTVTAQNGQTQQYTVTVNVVSVTQVIQKLITSFALTGFTPAIKGHINNDNHTVYVVVPDGTDLTKLAPIIEVSANASVAPASGSVQDFTNPVTYTVTDAYGTTQNYIITIVTESNSG